MSKTDKTRPWWVRLGDAPMSSCVPVHDHRFGGCTLPAEITADTICAPGVTGCHWVVSASHGWRRCRRNGCREWSLVCREDRRRDRHDARRALRAYLG
ncbi:MULTISPECIES: hypothetical protein [Actinosynnema]|uniref:hypothetical protein n=1 Tax=Actinosynnema TaxID=40566 RepID=UPI0020A5F653|nr:hypothetical protein [Actinosynnema pretiosum]MCP2096180.1 hypothetical protein [Actinosynnema pretiosum]